MIVIKTNIKSSVVIEKIIKSTLPVIIGILTVLALLVIYNIIVYNGDALNQPDDGFFKYFVPFAIIIAILIQITLTLPFWEKFKSRVKVIGLTIVPFTGLISIVGGLAFGLVFWEPNLGSNELIAVTIDGIIAFAVYWSSNLLTLKLLEKMIRYRQSYRYTI